MMGQAEGLRIKMGDELTEEMELIGINDILTGAGEIIITNDELLEFEKETNSHLVDGFAARGQVNYSIKAKIELDKIKEGT